MLGKNRSIDYAAVLRSRPFAAANICGSSEYPKISGDIRFFQTACGCLVAAEVMGLPTSDEICSDRVFGFHIHGGNSCSGNSTDPFSNAMAHYNPCSCAHPHHAGDMPPLFENNGYAFSVFLTDRFSANEVIGKTVIIHSSPDDFTTQPSGNSGEKIACGQIVRVRK